MIKILGKLRFLLVTEEAAKYNEYYHYSSFSYCLLCSFGALTRKASEFLHESEEFFTDLSRKSVISLLRKHNVYPLLSTHSLGNKIGDSA
jgi:hypothetical protein